MNDNNKKMIVSVIYCSPSQDNRDFDSFMLHFQQPLREISTRKQTVSVTTGDFNVRSSSWWPDDINTSEGTNLHSLKPPNWIFSINNELSHIQTNSSSYVDIVFND